MAADKTLDDLFLDTVKDIYYAERQILKALPKMAKAAQSSALRAGFEQHLAETEVHVERLEQVFELLGKTPRGKTCDADRRRGHDLEVSNYKDLGDHQRRLRGQIWISIHRRGRSADRAGWSSAPSYAPVCHIGFNGLACRSAPEPTPINTPSPIDGVFGQWNLPAGKYLPILKYNVAPRQRRIIMAV